MSAQEGLRLDGLVAGYDQSTVLQGVSIDIPPGTAVTIIGRNGMGKTTTVRACMGLIPLTSGEIWFDGKPLHGQRPAAIARTGIGLVPEGRHIFGSLNVEENLRVTAKPGVWNLDFVYELFPQLHERRKQSSRTLSGGEQQMLATGRAIMTNPKLLVLDEATEGLAPTVRQVIWHSLEVMKKSGLSLLIIDRNLQEMAKLVDRHHVLEKGRVVWAGTSHELLGQPEIVERYLGI